MDDDLRVLYNGSCPICSREVRGYEAYTSRRGLPVVYEDLHQADLDEWGVDRDTAERQLHVIWKGEVHCGVDAFILLWSAMPRFRWMGAVLRLPVLRWVARVSYDHAVAPALYQFNRWRRRSARS